MTRLSREAVIHERCNRLDDSTTPYSIHIVREIDVRKRLELLVRDFVVTGTGLSTEKAATLVSSAHASARESELSERERDILKLLAQGVTDNDRS